jgi:hypothetical protein
MICSLILDDWRQLKNPDSIYNTDLGLHLTAGDLHSGSTFEATIALPPDIEAEIATAWNDHTAYPVFRVLPSFPHTSRTHLSEEILTLIEALGFPLAANALRERQANDLNNLPPPS